MVKEEAAANYGYDRSSYVFLVPYKLCVSSVR